jgi:hypothetical protein
MTDTDEVRKRDEYWSSDEYLKRNAAGAHANSQVILTELERLKSELKDVNEQLNKFDRNFWALGFGIVMLMLLIWMSE